MIRVLVTGANGQLGKSIQKIAADYPKLSLTFNDSEELDITDYENANAEFTKGNYQFCINCAAYTNVEKAEKESKKAFAVNAEGVRNLAKICLTNKVTLIHISTDYVFDGDKPTPYTTHDKPNPINVYGASKLQGEKYVQEILASHFIIRTSWLYSEFGKNFYKTILQKAQAAEILRVTDDQIGCPTHATNLAEFILDTVASGSTAYGLYHFTDGEAMSWYGFARQILENYDKDLAVRLEKAENYYTLAKRPKNSVLKTE